MSFLFKIEGKVVFPNEETLLIYPFKQIWERDQSEGKQLAIQEFTYIEFMSSQKKSNPFKGYRDSVKKAKIKEEVFKGVEDWEPDGLIVDGIKYWEEFQKEASPTYSLYVAAKIGADQLRDFLLKPGLLDERNSQGNPMYKPRELTSALKDVSSIAADLDKLEKKVEEELFEEVKRRSGKEISPFANPDSL